MVYMNLLGSQRVFLMRIAMRHTFGVDCAQILDRRIGQGDGKTMDG